MAMPVIEQSMCSSSEPSSTSTANTIEARPRGPNQPVKATVGVRAPVPSNASHTGAMRMTVRLSTA